MLCSLILALQELHLSLTIKLNNFSSCHNNDVIYSLHRDMHFCQIYSSKTDWQLMNTIKIKQNNCELHSMLTSTHLTLISISWMTNHICWCAYGCSHIILYTYTQTSEIISVCWLVFFFLLNFYSRFGCCWKNTEISFNYKCDACLLLCSSSHPTLTDVSIRN